MHDAESDEVAHGVDAWLLRDRVCKHVSVHITRFHLVLVSEGKSERVRAPNLTSKVNLPLIAYAVRRPLTHAAHIRASLFPLSIYLATNEHFALGFTDESTAVHILERLKSAASIGTLYVILPVASVEQMYAFHSGEALRSGWDVYNVTREFKRQGLGTSTRAWRFSSVNASYALCPTYPSTLVVPANISDNTLLHAAKHRSKGRVPVLTYLHWANSASLTRSSQPLVGITQNRSIQDEKLVEAIFTSKNQGDRVYGSTMTNMIVDARPTANAMANHAKGAGSENMEFYKNCKKVYLGIDNIHAMRDSLTKIQTALRLVDERPTFNANDEAQVLDELALRRSHWLDYISTVLQGTLQIVRNIHVHSSHVLVHCSDGWDRTAQLVSLAQLCLDPYFRTMKGFAVLIEKDWLSFGYQFQERHGLTLTNSSRFDLRAPHRDLDDDDDDEKAEQRPGSSFWDFTKSITAHFQANGISQTAPIFFQFLDCVWQLQRQFPERFEFQGAYLAEIVRETFSGTSGTFLFSTERDRFTSTSPGKPPPVQSTPSVWDTLLPGEAWRNPRYNPLLDDREGRGDQGVLFVRPKDVRYASDLFRRPDAYLNARLDAERLDQQRLQDRLAEAQRASLDKAPNTDPIFPEDTFHNAARSVRSLFSDGWNRVQEAMRKQAEEQPKDPPSPPPKLSMYNPWAEQTHSVQSEFDALSLDAVARPASSPERPAEAEPPPSTDPLGASTL